MTRQVGTSEYMAPEVTLGGKYNKKIDVFSFGILICALMNVDNDLYGLEFVQGVEIKVAQDENFRPNIKKECFEKVPWLKELMITF